MSARTKEQERKRRAIRKGVRTRLANQASIKRWREVDLPAARRVEKLFNYFLELVPVSVRWDPLVRDTGVKLKHGAEYGRLQRVLHGGRVWRVLPEGYKRPKDFHAGFWEPLVPAKSQGDK